MNDKFLHAFLLFAAVVSSGLVLLLLGLTAALLFAPELLAAVVHYSLIGLCLAFLTGIVLSVLNSVG